MPYKRNKIMKTLSAAMLILFSVTASAQTPRQNPQAPLDDSPLVQLLKSCDQANTTCQKHSQDQTTLIKDQDAQLKTLSDQNKKLEDEASKPGNSRLLWFVAGMLTTGLTVYLVKK